MRPGGRPFSVWRPVGPPGYASLGDVGMPGRDAPSRPVNTYKDVANQGPAAQVGQPAEQCNPLCHHCHLLASVVSGGWCTALLGVERAAGGAAAT
jgi:hypothetical protein